MGRMKISDALIIGYDLNLDDASGKTEESVLQVFRLGGDKCEHLGSFDGFRAQVIYDMLTNFNQKGDISK